MLICIRVINQLDDAAHIQFANHMVKLVKLSTAANSYLACFVVLAGSVYLTNSFFFQTPVLDFNNQLLAPGGKGTWGSWGKGSSGGTSAKPADSGRCPILM